MADPEKIVAVTRTPLEVIAPTWVYLLAALAGFVAFLEKLNAEIKGNVSTTWRLRTLALITQVASSALAAVLTHQILHALKVDEVWQLPLVGIGAHMGTEALKAMGDVWKQKIGLGASKTDVEGKETP